MMKSSLTRSCNVVENIALLLAQSGNDCKHSLGKVTTCATLSSKAALAPEHDWPERALGRIVRGVYPLDLNKRPQRRLVLEQRATQRRTLKVLTRRPFTQEGTDLLPQLRGIDAKRGALQRAIPHAVPPV